MNARYRMGAESPRISALDFTRGLAALSVAVYHYGAGPALARSTGFSWLDFLSVPGANGAVPVLVALSGFCIHLSWLTRKHNDWSTRNFFITRFWRIYPAWLFAVTLSVLLCWFSNRPPSPFVIVTHVTLTSGFFDDYTLNPVLWTVSLEACLYVLYPAWLFLRVRYGLRTAVSIAGVVSLASTTALSMITEVPTGPTIWFFPSVWIGWVSGAFLAELWTSRNSGYFLRPAWLLAGALFLAALTLLPNHGSAMFYRIPLMIIFCLWPLSLILCMGTHIKPLSQTALTSLWRTISSAGCFSYSLYLLHMPLIQLRLELEQMISLQLPLKTIFYSMWFGLILFLSWLGYRWIEKPSINFGFRLIRQPTAATA